MPLKAATITLILAVITLRAGGDTSIANMDL
jgi:hypothetical protein